MSASTYFVAWIIATVAWWRERRRRISAEKKMKVFGVMFSAIVKNNPDTVQAYFNGLIEDDRDEEE